MSDKNRKKINALPNGEGNVVFVKYKNAYWVAARPFILSLNAFLNFSNLG